MMKEVYLELHPQSEQKWDATVSLTGDAQAKSIQDLFKTTHKGDFAQVLAEKINSSGSFIVPDYIRIAIEALVK